MGIEPTSEVWEAVPRIMRLLRELAQICKAGLELAYSERCGPPQPFISLVNQGLPLHGDPFFLRLGQVWARNSSY